MKDKKLDVIDRLVSELEYVKKEYLRLCGWEERCEYPGSYWLWSKKIPDSGTEKVRWRDGTYVMTMDEAVKMQRVIDALFSEDEEREKVLAEEDEKE